jgi:site-specific DNA recombinase
MNGKPTALHALRAVTYSRFSTDQQRESSIEAQQRGCHDRAKREGMSLIKDFTDRGISGSDNSRPQYLDMLASAARGEFDVLVIESLSRVWRDSVEQEQAIRRLEFGNVRIIATQDGYDSLSKARKLQRQGAGMINEMYRDTLSAQVYRSQKEQAIKSRWLGGRPFGYALRPILDAAKLDPYGQPDRIGTMLQVEPEQGKMILEIFTRWVRGESCGAIAADLNFRGVPSAGSTWDRKVRRCKGWTDGSVRTILLNPLYKGLQRWSASHFVQHPDTKKYLRRAADKDELIANQIESLRIVSDDLYQRAQARFQTKRNPAAALKRGGKSRYVLSGLLKCDCCGRSYILADNRSYACGSFIAGGEALCSNRERVRRDVLERILIDPINRELLSPERVARMAKEFEAEHLKRINERSARAGQAPKELAELEARIARLKGRLAAGDADLEPDELQAAIDKASAKRQELISAQVGARDSAKVLSLLPKAAAMYRKSIEQGLTGNPQAAAHARVILGDLMGMVTLKPGGKGELWASYRLNPAALVKGAGIHGRGDRI